MRRVPIRDASLLAVGLACALAAQPVAAAGNQPSAVDPNGIVVTATFHGYPIDPALASHYFCHTRDYPAVRCFDSQAEVDADLGMVEPTPGPAEADSSTDTSIHIVVPDWSGGAYTIAYWDINYGGSALTVYGAVPALSVLGWDDAISSIKSVNCGIPRYYLNPNYGGSYWQNSCNSWSANLYSVNDTFSSVINEAP
ncbi:MAG TPA: hypothetical protein VF337_04595 [Candidatus Limnocylindrales bacterium]